MKAGKIGAWIIFALGTAYFFLPLIATFEFSLRLKRGEYSFEAYRVVFADERFQETFSYSVAVALLTIIFGVLLVVPTAYWIRLKLPYLRPVVEFITLLPLVIPAIVIVFGYLRMYNSSSFLPFTGSRRATDMLLIFGYATLALPYMYRAVDTGLRAIDIRTLTEAAEMLGARWPTIIARIILPNVLIAVLSGAFLTFAIVIGEFTMASLLNRPAFGPYMQNIGANRAYDRRHKFVASTVWAPTFYKGSKSSIGNYVLNGWSFAPIYTYYSGARYSGTVTGTSLNRTFGGSHLPVLGRNSFILPSLHNIDARLSKRFRLTETMNLEFLAEAFNIVNRTHVFGVESAMYQRAGNATTLTFNSNFGNVTGAQSTNYRERQIQFAARFQF